MLLSATVAVRFCGALGILAGVMELLVPDDVLVPSALVALTVNVYGVPLVRPVTVATVEPLMALCKPSLEVTV